MKKTLSLGFLAAVLAVGTAVAGKMRNEDPHWLMNDNSIVTGTANYIKTFYCAGANNIQCAVQIEDPFVVIRKS
ncbi:MAG TPA: hypothetical protein VJ720_05035 [Chitinophaga sp.]|uniref:Uncharacterized protein n=1 Tax=Chitinophaga tropicalis TaxID=2683588 RepID=A0A7K1U3X3_9BACT|nr:hypothetical protein [Chitinophaga tropicalis]MVT08986.1 hypothetical protein [Chitinophaga tropicalis]HJT73356.1 hypothetical protein [Chitinophaga sp.]